MLAYGSWAKKSVQTREHEREKGKRDRESGEMYGSQTRERNNSSPKMPPPPPPLPLDRQREIKVFMVKVRFAGFTKYEKGREIASRLSGYFCAKCNGLCGKKTLIDDGCLLK